MRFRERSEAIQAVQFDGTAEQGRQLLANIPGDRHGILRRKDDTIALILDVNGSVMKAEAGDWIMFRADGTPVPVSDAVIQERFDLVPDPV